MNFTNLKEHYHELLNYLEKEAYTQGYIRRIKENVRWILKNEKNKSWRSYIDIYHDRVSGSESKGYKRNHRVAFSAIQQFDLHGEYPTRRIKNCFIKRGAYYELIPDFKEVIDCYTGSTKIRDLKESTVKGNASGAANFLLAMQKRGVHHLDHISEEDVFSFFLDDEGNVSR